MANVVTGNVWVIDTGSAALATRDVIVRGVRWVGATTNAHEAILTNAAGTVVWASKAATAGLGIDTESAQPFAANGLSVTSLGSGKLYVYVD